jgi:hypothetical protein
MSIAPPPPRAPLARQPSARPAAPPPAPALLPLHVARLIGFVALAALGALQWSRMVQPASSDALLGCVLVGAGAGYGLSVVARRRPPAVRRIAFTLLAASLLLLFALAAAGVPGRLFKPHGWDDLAAGIDQGLGAVSTVRTPYGGLDEWTRIVIVLGGCLLVGLAALLAFVPRRGGRFGYPVSAAVVLGALYTTPVMQHDLRLPFLAGLVFALLLATFLWLERVQRRGAGLAAALVAAGALGGYVAAPRLDGDRALLDYEQLAQSLTAAPTTQYRWNHDYGPLDWPRDGREMLRVQARHRAYWKAMNLDDFDGRAWVQDTGDASNRLETALRPEWVQRIKVTLRSLRTRQFVAAGSTLDISDSPRQWTSYTPGIDEVSGDDPLRRGHAYRAKVYTPRPSPAQLRTAGSAYHDVPPAYGLMHVAATPRHPAATISFPWWNAPGGPVLVGADGASALGALNASPYGRVYALAQRLRAGTHTPYRYVRAVERYLAGPRFRYDETPPPSRAPLADFLLRDHAGYCQHFSGAMALLLRMGGVPARVASGFSPGVLDPERDEYVVRDVDAHSWVEYWAPGIGWVTRDPTPAEAPARAQTADLAAGGGSDPVTFSGSERALGRAPDAGRAAVPAGASAEKDGPSATALAGGGLLALAVVAAVTLVWRRRRRARRADADPELAELRRALQRSGRVPPADLTLEALAARLGGTPARGYVRTIADARFGYGDGRPTRADRAALRRELGAGLGARGRMRAWWALPPR